MTHSIDAIVHVADAWTDPDHPPRAEAAEKCLEASDILTEPSLTFALNQFMNALETEGMDPWFGKGRASASVKVGLVVDDPVPTETLRFLLAAWGTGHGCLVRTGEPAAPLLQAFAKDVHDRGLALSLEFMDEGDVYERADALLAVPTVDTLDRVQQKSEENGFSDAERYIVPPTYSITVLDGEEVGEEREDLAEDLLLYEGAHRRSVSLIWAPRDLSPDPYLEAMAQFRGIVPAHASTPGALEMPKALLDARDAPHAYAEGLQFLLSKGSPEPQPGAHIRWSEYDALGTVRDWIREHEPTIHTVVARSSLRDRLEVPGPLRAPGHVHRPEVPDEEDRAAIEFLTDLGP